MQQTRVIEDQDRADGAPQEEVEAHAEVEDGVKVLTSPDFPYKGAVHCQVETNKNPFEQIKDFKFEHLVLISSEIAEP